MTSPIESPQGGLEVVIEAGCAYVTLVDRRMSWAMLNALKSLPSQLLDADVRCVVVRSNGLDFCHGIDLSDADLLEQVAADGGRTVATLGGEMVAAWSSLPIPTVAVLSNWTIGAGACLAFACDFRLAAPITRISFPEVDRGMHLSWGIIPRLVRECGAALTRRLTMLGDPVAVEEFPAEVFTISESPRSEADELAAQLAAKPREAVQAIKTTIAGSLVASPEQLQDDVARFAASVASQGFADAMTAWLAGKR